MGNIFYIMGKSASGKDTIYKELCKAKQGVSHLKPVIPYTTRPIRAGEREGVEYHFTDEQAYQGLLQAGKVIEQREYHTYHGIWRYFTVDDGQIALPEGQGENDQNYIMIGTLAGYMSMRAYFGAERVVPILVEVDDGVRLQRALNRERKQEQPRYEEMCRRFLADSEDFSEEKILAAGIGRRFQNNNFKRCLKQIQDFISVQG